MIKRFLRWLGDLMISAGAWLVFQGCELADFPGTLIDFDDLDMGNYTQDLEDAARELLIHIDDCKCGRTIWADAVARLIDDRPERQEYP